MRYDVIVAGLGIHGLMTAYMLARRGLKVIGLDPYPVPHAHGSSHGQTRVHRRAYFEAPFYVPLLKRADDLWVELSREMVGTSFSLEEGARVQAGGGALLSRTGVLVIGRDDGRLASGALASAEQYRIHVKVLQAAEAMQLWPGLSIPEGHIAILEPLAGVLQVEPVMHRLLQLCEDSGAVCCPGAGLDRWQLDDNGITARAVGIEEVIEADRLVIAAGAWTAGLAGLDLPLRTERQYQVQFSSRNGSGYGAGIFPALAIDRGAEPMLYGIPDFGNGIKLAFHHGGQLGDPHDYPAVSDNEVRELHGVASKWLPWLLPEARASWTCVYTNTPDEHFIIDRHPATERVLLLSCCSGHGYKFAPVIGEIASQLLVDGGTQHDISQFRLSRFTGAVAR
ncbi:N-methyl-L-tryptophan oxidase [bacterium]|nr:N-methyl-L-tryptophan oxidase [bacterium]